MLPFLAVVGGEAVSAACLGCEGLREAAGGEKRLSGLLPYRTERGRTVSPKEPGWPLALGGLILQGASCWRSGWVMAVATRRRPRAPTMLA